MRTKEPSRDLTQGKGISCDALPGYTKTTELVGYGGHGSSGPYSYYTKN